MVTVILRTLTAETGRVERAKRDAMKGGAIQHAPGWDKIARVFAPSPSPPATATTIISCSGVIAVDAYAVAS